MRGPKALVALCLGFCIALLTSVLYSSSPVILGHATVSDIIYGSASPERKPSSAETQTLDSYRQPTPSDSVIELFDKVDSTVGGASSSPTTIFSEDIDNSSTTEGSLEDVTSTNDTHQYKICAMTRVNDEAHNLPEWIEYHHLLGIEQFYIYDDCSRDSTLEIMSNYAAIGLAQNYSRTSCDELFPYKFEQVQFSEMYSHAALSCEYVVAADLDEYITLQTDLYNGTFYDYMNTKEEPYTRLFWYSMGHDNKLQAPSGLIVETYLNGTIRDLELVKTVVRTAVVTDWRFSHFPTSFAEGQEHLAPILENAAYLGDDVRYVDQMRLYSQPFYLKHYSCKSLTEYMAVRASRQESTLWRNDPLESWQMFQFPLLAPDLEWTLEMANKTKIALASRSWKVPDYARFYFHD